MTETVTVAVRRLPHGQGLDLPTHATEGSAGVDLLAAVETTILLAPGQRRAIPTGLAIALPLGFEAQIRPRSGLALRHGLTLMNTPGTVDADYRGEVQVILVNLGSESVVIERGMRIAQMIVARHARVAWTETDTLPETGRGSGGFGSTGA